MALRRAGINVPAERRAGQGPVPLRIVTWNIHRAIGVDRRFRLDRVADILAHHSPDVALLQEVDEGAPRSGRLHLARELALELGYEWYVVGHNVRLREGHYGNATLSRLPIVAARNIDLSVGRRKRRGCQYTALALPGPAGDGERPRGGQAGAPDGGEGQRLEVFNLHLGLSAQERARQIGLLARAPELERLGRSTPCVVGGDFNDWRYLLHPVLTDVMRFECATQRHFSGRDALRTYPSLSPRGGLDRIYYRGRMRCLAARTCRLGLSRVASDHLPVIGDFVVERDEGAPGAREWGEEPARESSEGEMA